MNNEIVRRPDVDALATTAEIAERLRPHVERAKEVWEDRLAQKTKANYLRLYGNFVSWCDENRLCPLPCDSATLITYLSSKMEDCKAGTLKVIAQAIRYHQEDAGHPSPITKSVKDWMKSAAKKLGTRPSKKLAATTELTRQMADACDQSPRGLRDRAILLLLFGAARRRSELVALDWSDLEWLEGEVRVLVRRSKTDQAGAGQVVRVAMRADSAYCPGAALLAWQDVLKTIHPTSDAVFVALARNVWLERLDDAAIAKIVKRKGKDAGFSEEVIKRLSGHSGRRGWITSAVRAGKTLDQIKATSKHATIAALGEYIEENRELDDSLL